MESGKTVISLNYQLTIKLKAMKTKIYLKVEDLRTNRITNVPFNSLERALIFQKGLKMNPNLITILLINQ